MENDFIDMMEPTPKLHTKKCQFISKTIAFFLQYTNYIIAIFVWILYDYFLAFFALILSFILVGIIRAKMRVRVIPPKQLEYPYNDKGIADWFTAKEIC